MRSDSQTNVRLPKEKQDVLEAIAFLHDERPHKVLERLATEYLERQAEEPRVKALLELRREAAS